jgi:hypothetical protein
MDRKASALTGTRWARLLAANHSAEFKAWTTLGTTGLTDAAPVAHGVTQFGELVTRCTQKTLAPAAMREGRTKAASSSNALERVILSRVLQVMEEVEACKEREYFYSCGRRWELSEDGTWSNFANRPHRPGIRNGADPAIPLEALAALVSLSETGLRESGPSATVRYFEGIADLRQVEDRLVDFLEMGDNRTVARGWYESAPVKLWIDKHDQVRQISWAPLPPNATESLWWTVELSEFGATLETPNLPM